MILETAAIASVAKPLIEKMVVELITPKITQFAGWCKGKYKENMIPTAEHFQEYLERSYVKYSIVNTLVFHNSQRLLKEIYVAQTIVKEHQSEGDNEIAKIDRLPVSLIEKYKKILITDTAGMGKSTIMKRMFIDLIDKGLNLVGIPVYIELNKLNKENTILDEIQDALSSLSKQFDNDLLLMLNNNSYDANKCELIIKAKSEGYDYKLFTQDLSFSDMDAAAHVYLPERVYSSAFQDVSDYSAAN